MLEPSANVGQLRLATAATCLSVQSLPESIVAQGLIQRRVVVEAGGRVVTALLTRRQALRLRLRLRLRRTRGATANIRHQVQRALLLDVVVGQRATVVLEPLPREEQLLPRGHDASRALDLRLQPTDAMVGPRIIELQGRAGEALDVEAHARLVLLLLLLLLGKPLLLVAVRGLALALADGDAHRRLR